jgi:hypothetical protein
MPFAGALRGPALSFRLETTLAKPQRRKGKNWNSGGRAFGALNFRMLDSFFSSLASWRSWRETFLSPFFAVILVGSCPFFSGRRQKMQSAVSSGVCGGGGPTSGFKQKKLLSPRRKDAKAGKESRKNPILLLLCAFASISSLQISRRRRRSRRTAPRSARRSANRQAARD